MFATSDKSLKEIFEDMRNICNFILSLFFNTIFVAIECRIKNAMMLFLVSQKMHI